MGNIKKTISLDDQLYTKSDYSKESIKQAEEEFDKCFNTQNKVKNNGKY